MKLPATDAEAVEALRAYWGRKYSPGEVISDAVVHCAAIIIGAVGFALLISNVIASRGAGEVVAVCVYAIGYFTMLGCSLAYNMWPMSATKLWLRRFDHSAIYIMIAGTCTAFLSQLDSAAWSASLIAAIWLGASVGIVAKLFFPGRFEGPLLALYLGLGWVCMIGIVPIWRSLSAESLALLVIGGALYTGGVVFYRWEALRYHNTIWHGFVTVAAACHFAGIALAMGGPAQTL
ncbi:MAG: hemolysin III family protein [Pseudomonadota bacterium]